MAPAPTFALEPMHTEHWQGAWAEHRGIEAWLAQGLTVPALAWVEYDAAAVIYGRRGGVTPERTARAAERGCTLLARRSGGGAVLAGPWLLGLHLWLPCTHAATTLSATRAMVAVGQPLAQALARAGGATRMAGAQDIALMAARIKAMGQEWNCFAGLSHGELLDANGRKCVGLAQARTRAGVLLSAGVLTAPTPWETLDAIHLGPAVRPSPARELVSQGLALPQASGRQQLKQHIAQALQAWLSNPQTAADGECRAAALMEA